jgi:DNA-binding transcriptional LysR family regulator
MYLALPKDHPLAQRRVVPLAEFADTEWLCGSAPTTCGEAVIRSCRDAGFEPRIGFETDDYNVMQGFIAAGLGVTLLPDLALANLHPDLVVRQTDPPAPERRVWAVSRPAGARSPATEEMISILAEVGAAYQKRTGELTLVA